MLYDISVPIAANTVTWPGDPAVAIEPCAAIAAGDSCNVSALHLGAHTGTHIDAPFHFIESGKTIEHLTLAACYGEAVVVKVAGDAITAADVARVPTAATRVLFKSRNSALWSDPTHRFDTGFVALTPEAATLLAARPIQLVGVDYLSVEVFDHEPGNPVHHALLHAEIVLLEGLDLRAVAPGTYTLSALPLRIVGGDGSPCRAVLFK